nr:flavodoxin domain-containing protein [uncultured Butyrivibrio sp.]
MKRLIVYFSLEGNTELIADELSKTLSADKLRLVPKKTLHTSGFGKFFWNGKSAVMAEKPELEPYNVDLSAYDQIIFGFPVWAGTFTPPLRTFISENKEKLKNKGFATFACQSGAGAEKAFAKLQDCLGIDGFATTAIFIDPKEKPSEENALKLNVFAKKLGGED